MKILLVDDHAVLRAGLRRLLAATPVASEILEASTGRAVLPLVREHRPDLVLLDLNLPDIGGLELLRRLRAEVSAPRVLVFTMHADPIFAARALEAGAAGYVSKTAEPEELLEAVTRIAQGRRYVEAGIAQALAVREAGDPMDGLTRRELEILRLLREGCDLAGIADAIGVSYKTVANSCVRMKTKLGVARTADLLRVALRLDAAERG
ncbi:MAG: response regulator transcription factor [Acetobacteraceae bacterium]|nr:response regulator transcription factor [Acetobacteraceae bacterium]